MKTIKIGIYDEERDYVQLLCSYLQEWGKGKWKLFGYTDEELLINMENKMVYDVILSTNKGIFSNLLKEDGNTIFIFLSEEKNEETHGERMTIIYRYQSAKEIAKEIHNQLKILGKQEIADKKIIGIYSPISGCGKTTLACDIVENSRYGTYLYLGMEDYASFETYTDTGEVLYYIKEQNEDHLRKVIEQEGNKLILGQGAFENRLLNRKDLQWLKSIMKKSIYDGFICDMGTGSIESLDVFMEFDTIIVPYLQGDVRDYKLKNFRNILTLYGLDEYEDKIRYLDMTKKENIEKVVEKVLKEQ